MHKIEMRDGRWLTATNGDEKIVTPIEAESIGDPAAGQPENKFTIVEGTGIRVETDAGEIVENLVVRPRRQWALELADVLLDKYRDR